MREQLKSLFRILSRFHLILRYADVFVHLARTILWWLFVRMGLITGAETLNHAMSRNNQKYFKIYVYF